MVTAQLSVEVLPSPLNVSSSFLLESQVWLSTMPEHNFACQSAANRIFGCARRTEAGYSTIQQSSWNDYVPMCFLKYFFFCIFVLKQFERKHWVVFLILNIPLYLISGCSPSFIAWFLCTSHLQFLCQRVLQSKWLQTAEDRCCKHGVGTAAVTVSWICPEFMLCYTGCLPWDL